MLFSCYINDGYDDGDDDDDDGDDDDGVDDDIDDGGGRKVPQTGKSTHFIYHTLLYVGTAWV